MIPPLLRENLNFRRFFIGQSVSLLGDQVTALALPLTAVLALDATAGQMGVLTTLYLVPNLIFSLHAGAWVDRRGGRRMVMLMTDVGRGLLIGSIPIAYAFGHLGWTQLYVVAFLSGTLTVFFYVAYGAMIQMIVPRTDYVQANSLVHGSRAFSFVVGNMLGGLLVALLRGPYALAVDAVSYFWSALFLEADAPRRAAGRSAGDGRADGRRALDPAQRDHPRGAARRRDAEPLQLHVLRAVRALRDALAARRPGDARARARCCGGWHARRLIRDRAHRQAVRHRAHVRVRLLPLPRAADPRAARRRAAVGRDRAACSPPSSSQASA